MVTRMSSIAGLSGYVLETLRTGANFALYRGRQRDNPTPVLAVALASDQPSRQSLPMWGCGPTDEGARLRTLRSGFNSPHPYKT